MKNFTYANPVKILFGRNSINNIVNEIPSSSKVLITYGGGSIKRNGVYDQVVTALKGYEYYEFSGIEANPHYETCLEAIKIIHEKDIDFILAVGGGSVIDATKFIAASSCLDKKEDPWVIMSGHKISKALPFGVILTLPATGSEMNCAAVITKASDQNKIAFRSPLVFPKFSVLDPTVTFSLPQKQVANGIIDSFIHILEQYLTGSDENTLFQDNMAEGFLKTILEEGPKAFKNHQDYDTMANLMWASSWALNGWLGCGTDEDWATHRIGHELTAFYGLDHAQTLAIVLPGTMTIMKEQKEKKIARLGKEVFKLNAATESELVDKTIQAVEAFFESLGTKTHLSDYNLGFDAIEKVSERLNKRGWKLGEKANITGDVATEILKVRL